MRLLRIIFQAIFLGILTSKGSKFCDENPKLIQCIASKNQFVLPDREYCNPFDNSCRTGDLIDPRVANCEPRFTSSHIKKELTSGFRESTTYR